MTRHPACNPRQAFVLDSVPGDLRATLLALADQHEAGTQRNRPAAQGQPWQNRTSMMNDAAPDESGSARTPVPPLA